jgi:hypothetical protein
MAADRAGVPSPRSAAALARTTTGDPA